MGSEWQAELTSGAYRLTPADAFISPTPLTRSDNSIESVVDHPSSMVPSRIFRSRWSAVFWAGGIMWTAYDAVNGQPHDAPATNQALVGIDATGEPADPGDLAMLANAMR